MEFSLAKSLYTVKVCRMIRCLQVVIISTLAMAAPRAEEPAKPFSWIPLKIQASAFTSDLGMLDPEREEYATNLANCAATGIVQAKASQAALEISRRLLTLALHLSPRNKRSIILNFQLGKGMLPEVAKGDYSPQVMARLLLTRGQLLAKTESMENHLLARMFFQLAAELDPKNEDAIYASEVDRLDHGNVDWTFPVVRPRVEPEVEPTPTPTPVPDKEPRVTPPVRPRPAGPPRPVAHPS